MLVVKILKGSMFIFKRRFERISLLPSFLSFLLSSCWKNSYEQTFHTPVNNYYYYYYYYPGSYKYL